MSLIDSIINGAERLIEFSAKNMTGLSLDSYCPLETAVPLSDSDKNRNADLSESYILTTSDCKLITFYDLQGTFQQLGDDEYAHLIQDLGIRLAPVMSKPGHHFEGCFEKDPGRSYDELVRYAAPMISAARKIGLDVEDIILDRCRRNSHRAHYEQNLIAIITHPTVVDKNVWKAEVKEQGSRAAKAKLSKLPYDQNPATVYDILKNAHDTTLEQFERDLKNAQAGSGNVGVLASRLSAAEAMKRLRIMINRENTSQNWKPQLLGSQSRMYQRGNGDAASETSLIPPKLKYQLCTFDYEEEDTFIKSSGLYHSSISMELMPQELTPFHEFMAQIDRSMPYRVCYTLAPDGLAKTKGRQMALMLVGFMGTQNKMIKESFNYLLETKKTAPIMAMQFTFSTWAEDKTLMTRRISQLEKAVQGWGSCEIMRSRGDHCENWLSTIPGAHKTNTAPVHYPPLEDSLYLLPFLRPATPFGKGSNLLTQSPDGKIFPVKLASELQDTWIELLSSTPGGGKSLFMNVMNFAAAVAPGNIRLPLGTILDIGPSSSGLIELLADALPAHRRHEVASMKLLNTKEFATNVLDTQLGCRYPTIMERQFIIDFVTLLCAEATSMAAPEGTSDLVTMLIEHVYKETADGTSRAIYELNVVPEIDAILAQHKEKRSEEFWASPYWWEIVDMLFELGHVREAAIAQRQAVPTLADLQTALTSPQVKQIFGGAQVKGSNESLIAYVSRKLVTATQKFPIFAGRTQFEISSETRIVSIDLAAVVGGKNPDGQLTTGIMYLIGLHLGCRNFFLSREILLPVVPRIYEKYHLARISDIENEKKILAADEFHNTGKNPLVVSPFIKYGREGRKLGLRVLIATQYLKDVPEELLDAATTIYVMRGGSDSDEKILKEQFKVSDSTLRSLRRDCTGPTPNGSNFLALFKTKLGMIVQTLTNIASSHELWSFSTTLEDMSLRKRLNEELGRTASFKILTSKFPSGSAIKAVSKLKAADVKDDDDEAKLQAVTQLANMLVKEYRETQHESTY
ncbi:TPA: hypothetical protein ACF3I9_004472 [Klebsiella aerogenes]